MGTAHVGFKDALLVRLAVEHLRPEAVLVELDAKRLPRVGFTLEELGPQAVVPPAPAADQGSQLPPGDPRGWAAAALAPVLREFVTKAYDSLTAKGMKAGGEFAAAIEAGRECGARIVLGDIESISTIETFLKDLAQTNPMNFMVRYTNVVTSELGDAPLDDLTVAGVEQMKADILSKGTLVKRLREEVPEFYRAFVGARDAHMAAAIHEEARQGARNVVAVVGLAHVEGIARELQERGWS